MISVMLFSLQPLWLHIFHFETLEIFLLLWNVVFLCFRFALEYSSVARRKQYFKWLVSKDY